MRGRGTWSLTCTCSSGTSGFGGLEPGGGLDLGFRGWRPHRNRSALELALMTGMRIQEWSTLLLPELGLTGGHRPAVTDVDLAACAK